MNERRFPILRSSTDKRLNPDYPSSVPWSVVAPHERQALRNHGGQSLETLARRGGLSYLEMMCVLEDRELEWHDDWTEANKRAVAFLIRLLASLEPTT